VEIEKMNIENCDACNKTWPQENYRIADLGESIAYLHHDQYFPGWTVLVLKQHATELFQLSVEVQQKLILEVSRMAEVLAEIYQAAKINYALLGNVVPHIHWHIIPRLTEDPVPREPVFMHQHETKLLTDANLEQEIAKIRTQLKM